MTSLRKRVLQWTLGLGILANTSMGEQGSLPPFYSNKVSEHYGLNVNFVGVNKSEITGMNAYAIEGNHGTINGVDLSVYGGNDDGTINGLKIAGVSVHKGQSAVYGAEIGVLNTYASRYRSNTHKVVGAQIGIFNMADELTGVQIGIVNYNAENNRWTLGFNWDF